MFTGKDVQALLQEPWWETVKNEVLRSISLRIAADQDSYRPHGSVLGQDFVDLINKNKEFRRFVQYLTTRAWSELVDDISCALSERSLSALKHREASLWYVEFQRFLASAWNGSIQESVDLRPFDHKTVRILIEEVERHVATGRPEFIANTIMEWLRDPGDHRLRKGTSMAVAFMMVRTWKEVLAVVSQEYKEDLSALDGRAGAAFFERLKIMVGGAMKEYWDNVKPEEKKD